MTRLKTALLAGLAVATAATPAWAQLASGRSGSSSLTMIEGQEVWDRLSEFGVCYASRNRASAYELVSTRAGSADEATTYRRLFRGESSCLGDLSEMRVDWQLVRGTIGEGLYRKSVPVPPQLAVTTAPTVDQVRNFSDAALCFTGAHSDAAKALIQTRVGAKAEDAAVTALLPGLGACIPAAAKNSLNMNTTMIRFRIAEALWKLGQIPPPRKVAQ
ncbi:MAG: hypothetical protein ABIW16_00020 [Sphingomicrobium sp.]